LAASMRPASLTSMKAAISSTATAGCRSNIS
jgi:hypothetical protein